MRRLASMFSSPAAVGCLLAVCTHGPPFFLFTDALARRAQGFDTHQLARPNFNFVPALRRSNPGCNITILTDQATQFAGLPPGVQVRRRLGLHSAGHTP